MSSSVNGTRQGNKAAEALEKIERVREARRHKFYLRDEHITLSHGSGGKATRNLIEGIFAPAFSNPCLAPLDDAATFTPDGGSPRLAFTTDSYVVNPLFFPGGDIGKLAVHGTIKGETKEEHEQKEGHYFYCERRQGAFSRSLTLPISATRVSPACTSLGMPILMCLLPLHTLIKKFSPCSSSA